MKKQIWLRPDEGATWQDLFREQVYASLCAADNQDVPLEEYPDRILEVLYSIVGPRHPTVTLWRNDAIRTCASIAGRYGEDAAAIQMLELLTE